jgi:hypothetical protein
MIAVAHLGVSSIFGPRGWETLRYCFSKIVSAAQRVLCFPWCFPQFFGKAAFGYLAAPQLLGLFKIVVGRLKFQ